MDKKLPRKSKSKIKNFKIYLDERFPLVKNGIFILVFTLSAFFFSRVSNKDFKMFIFSSAEIFNNVILLFIIMFCFFFQLRILDEFKDFEEDSKYRSYRPVPRGIISLEELKKIGIGTVIIQILLILLIDVRLIFFALLIWGYMFLMTKEFFVKEWITKKIFLYALSHIVVMLLFVLFVISTEKYSFSVQRQAHSSAIFSLFFVSYINGIILEIGRKTRKSSEEEYGVETYSKILGRERAVLTLIILFAIEIIFIYLGLHENYYVGLNNAFGKKYFFTGIILLLLIFCVSIFQLRKFIKEDLTGKIVENISGIWIMFSYLCMGFLQYIIFFNFLK